MDMPEDKESIDGLKKGDRSARNRVDEDQKDAGTSNEVCDVFDDGKKHLKR